jgi:hypothetical protein
MKGISSRLPNDMAQIQNKFEHQSLTFALLQYKSENTIPDRYNLPNINKMCKNKLKTNFTTSAHKNMSVTAGGCST